MTTPWDLRLGRWHDLVEDVDQVDALITDPPFSARTADGYKTNPRWQEGALGDQAGISYGSITARDVRQAVRLWAPRVRYWFVVFGDHISARWWETELDKAGWYTFAPLPYVKPAAPPRFLGDGPASQTEWIIVGRPRSNAYKERRGSRPGFYIARRGDASVTGAKDVLAMRAIVRDYSEPGDLIADPFAGSGTTLLAAVTEGRRAVGAEVNPETYAKARARLEAGWTPDLFGAVEPARAREQQSLFSETTP